MKKKVIIVIISVLVVISGCLFVMFNSSNKSYYVITNNNEEKIMNTNALTMMYETGPDTGEYQISSDTSWPLEGYTFNAELSRCENGSTLTWDEDTKTVLMEANVSDKCYVYFDKVPPVTLASYITNLYTEDGVNDLYYHDGQGTYTNADQEAGDNSYRYAGANPNNYVCFGSDAATCPTANLYRIIGVFDNEVKLIKSTRYLMYNKWNSEDNNTWNSSTKPDIRTKLNSEFLETISSIWQNKIATHAFKVGGLTTDNGYRNGARIAYNYEVGANSSSTTDSMKIGLMYVSDYYYGASPTYWTYPGYNGTNDSSSDYRAATSNNWMFMGKSEWTISRNSDYSDFAFYVPSNGNARISSVGVAIEMRPSFYLTSTTTYVSGSGTSSDPIRIT